MRLYNKAIQKDPLTFVKALQSIVTPECFASCNQYNLMIVLYTNRVESYNQSLWVCTGQTDVLTDKTPMLVLRPTSVTNTDGVLWLHHSEKEELDMGTATQDPETPLVHLLKPEMVIELVAFEPFWNENSIVGKLIETCEDIGALPTTTHVRTNHHSRPLRAELWVQL